MLRHQPTTPKRTPNTNWNKKLSTKEKNQCFLPVRRALTILLPLLAVFCVFCCAPRLKAGAPAAAPGTPPKPAAPAPKPPPPPGAGAPPNCACGGWMPNPPAAGAAGAAAAAPNANAVAGAWGAAGAAAPAAPNRPAAAG